MTHGAKRALVLAGLMAGVLLAAYACAPEEPKPVQTVTIPDQTYNPVLWGKAYPAEYDLWKQTELPEPQDRSRYKRGFDADRPTVDKLSEYPYMALLFNG